MSRHRYARSAVLALIALAAALLWVAGPVLRAEKGAVVTSNVGASSGATTSTTATKTATTAKATATASAKAAPANLTNATAGAQQNRRQQQAQQNQNQQQQNTNPVMAQRQRNLARQAAARRARAAGLKPGVAGRGAQATAAGLAAQPGVAALAAAAPGGVTALAAAPAAGIEGPGGVPHYFGPYGNWAFSPLPKGPIGSAVNTVSLITIDAAGTGYAVGDTVPVDDAYGSGSGAILSVTSVGAGGTITGLGVSAAGANYYAPVVDFATATTVAGTGAAATVTLDPTALTGGLQKFVNGVPLLGPAGANNIPQGHGEGQYIPVATAIPCTYSNQAADCFHIALVEYSEQMHRDLPATKLRGYVQIEPPGSASTPAGSRHLLLPVTYKGLQVFAYDHPHYLGPVIVAKGRVQGIEQTDPANGAPVPVRITFYNLLPVGLADATGRRPGDLFLPVDETVPGGGPGSLGEKYTQNRATIHLHGNNTVWISDGNVHQWISPAGETTNYPAGVSARNVPDMGTACDGGGPGLPGNSGCQTFFYTNAQSARLQFYHDHAHGITRLNVYAGEAAGYVITDAVEQDLITGTNVTGVNDLGLKVLPDLGVPLIIQDKTFVDRETVFAQDPTWNWGTGPRSLPLPGETVGRITDAVTGDLWYPHVYMTVQNPWDLTGTNAFGRWHYGPWFNPPTPTCVNGGPVGCIEVGPVPNEYANPANPGYSPLEPPFRPGVPNPSLPGESFLDTPLVNGTAYPFLEVEPRAYRFRVLNAANDRFVNLQLYQAYDKSSWQPAKDYVIPYVGTIRIPGSPTAACPAGGADSPLVAETCTEVKMVPVLVAPANQYGDTPSGIPDPTTAGPPWWLIGTEGGFMPKPVVVPQQPIGYNLNAAYFAYGVVNQHSLFLGPAERADVVVDFTGMAGQTLILYNDSPAPVPAGATPYDFYTGDGNQMDGGGAPNTQPGYGPNTRTIMQIRVKTVAPTIDTSAVTLPNLESVFAKTATKRGVFEVSQDPIVVPQAAYNSAYNASYPVTAAAQYAQIADTEKTFQPIDRNGALQAAVTIPFEMKGMHDEMGGVYDSVFGRMSGMLGLVNPASNVHVLIPYPLSSPPTDIVKGSLEANLVGSLADGTQIWRIFHNGVDTHPIHTHLFTSQLLDRVGQDGQFTPGPPLGLGIPVDPIDLGWKDTFKINPLEVTFVALRPTVPTPSQVPFEVPTSTRLIDPTLPEGVPLPPPAPAGWFDTAGNAIATILNHPVNFGWEYVWHCHILSHEEMDFMHTLVFAVPPLRPENVSGAVAQVNPPVISVTWTDSSITENQFRIEKAVTSAGPWTVLATLDSLTPDTKGGTVAYQDPDVVRGTTYFYRVFAIVTVGDTVTPGFPIMSAESVSATSPGILIPAVPIASISSLAMAFGNQAVNTTSAPQPVVLTNTGAAALTFSILPFTGTNPGDFAQTNSCGGVVAAGGGTCTINVTFRPTAAGLRNATMTITTNDPAHPSFAVTLTGTGILANTMHVAGLTRARTTGFFTWTARVTITVHNGSHQARSGVVVSGAWSGGGAGGSSSCTTNGNGQCTVTRTATNLVNNLTFTVNNLTRATFTYVVGDNHVTAPAVLGPPPRITVPRTGAL